MAVKLPDAEQGQDLGVDTRFTRALPTRRPIEQPVFSKEQVLLLAIAHNQRWVEKDGYLAVAIDAHDDHGNVEYRKVDAYLPLFKSLQEQGIMNKLFMAGVYTKPAIEELVPETFELRLSPTQLDEIKAHVQSLNLSRHSR